MTPAGYRPGRAQRAARAGVAGSLLAAASAWSAWGVGAPASATDGFCAGGGVNVVVDFQQLGGGAVRGCDPGGAGESASSVFPAAGFPLTYVQRQPGFVCRVSGKPASDPCVNTPPPDAYWSLWWSDGESGQWAYATEGVASLSVGEGGFLAASWQQGDSRQPPSVDPVNPHASEPAPSPRPSPKPSPKPSPSGGGAGGGGGSAGGSGDSGDGPPVRDRGPASSTPSATSPSASATRTRRPKPTAQPKTQTTSPSPSPTRQAVPASPSSPTAEALDAVESPAGPSDDDGLPMGVVAAVVGALAAAGGGAAWWRRRAG